MRKQRRYALFVRRPGEKRWERWDARTYPLEQARRVYQDLLLGLSLHGAPAQARLRPVR